MLLDINCSLNNLHKLQQIVQGVNGVKSMIDIPLLDPNWEWMQELKNGAYVAVEQVIIWFGGGSMWSFTSDLDLSDLEHTQIWNEINSQSAGLICVR